MGTTKTMLQGSDGIRYAWVLAVEGFEYLLTSGSASAAVTAWSGTDWSQALSGLTVDGEWEQAIEQWKPISSRSSLQFSIKDCDGNDTFALSAFKRDGAIETTLEGALAPAGTTLTVKATADFPSSGDVFVGAERIAYATKTGSPSFTLNTLTRGKYSPFLSNGSARYARGHYGHQVGESIVTRRPRVTDEATTWAGRNCGLWLHRVVGGVLDTKAQAQLVYAGKIVAVSDRSDGQTVIETEDLISTLNDQVVYGRQWNAKTENTIYLIAGTVFTAAEVSGGGYTSNPLTVVSSGASAPNEINEGGYTVGELLADINTWLAAEKNAARLTFTWNASVTSDAGPARTVITAKKSTSTSGLNYSALFKCNLRWVLNSLGFANSQCTQTVGGYVVRNDVFSFSGAITMTMTSKEQPTPYGVLTKLGSELGNSATIGLGGEVGTWWDQTDYLPQSIRALVPDYADSTAWGLVKIGDLGIYLARRTSATTLVIYESNSLSAHFGFPPITDVTARLSDDSSVRVTQVAVVSGTFANVMLRLFSSVAGDGANHATYDVYQNGLGAGIPYELLGSSFVNSVNEISAASGAELTLIVDKPTKLGEIISSDLLLRRAHIVWKDQGLRCTSWSTPTTSQALHAFAESNKASPAGVSDMNRSTTDESVDGLVNVVKIDYGRSIQSGEYDSSISISDQASVDEFGERAITIKARNVYKNVTQDGDGSVAALASVIGSWLPFFSRPLKKIRRSIDVSLFEAVAPGDICTISDNFARNPATGTRGMTGKPGVILSHRYDFRSGTGEVDIIVQDYDRAGLYAPAVAVDGYDNPTATLSVAAGDYAEAGEAEELTYFAAGENVWIVEIDPADPTAPTAWSRTIDSIDTGADTITLTAALSAPAYDSSKSYVVLSQKYSAAASTQTPDTYQADDADGLIEDSAQPYEFGSLYTSGAFTLSSVNAYGCRLAASSGGTVIGYGDGAAYDVHHDAALGRNLNHLVNRKTAISGPCLGAGITDAAGTAGWHILQVYPIYVGSGTYPAGYTRRLYVAPFLKVGSGTKSLRVTLGRHAPYGDTIDGASLYPPYAQATWSTSSTTYTTPSSVGLSTDARDSDGMAYIIIEAEAGITARGLSICNLGALEAL